MRRWDLRKNEDPRINCDQSPHGKPTSPATPPFPSPDHHWLSSMEEIERPGAGSPLERRESARRRRVTGDRRPIQDHMEPHGTVHGQTGKRTIHCIDQIQYTYLRTRKGIAALNPRRPAPYPNKTTEGNHAEDDRRNSRLPVPDVPKASVCTSHQTSGICGWGDHPQVFQCHKYPSPLHDAHGKYR